jgi:hypothetical protein
MRRMSELDEMLARLWRDYADLNPQAAAIHALLAGEGATIVNDHIALRTFGDPRVGIDVLARPFVRAGYRAAGEYRFREKKLVARHYAHDDPARPLVFVSELVLAECSRELRDVALGLIAQIPEEVLALLELPAAGRWWTVSYAQVEALRGESEYAAWLAAFGFCANHFTVLTNGLGRLADLGALVGFLEGHGFRFSRAGGLIKGSPGQGLEQVSTLASEVRVQFADGEQVVPGCYYEFARRYPLADGRWFRGFIEGSADKIFESTDRRARG